MNEINSRKKWKASLLIRLMIELLYAIMHLLRGSIVHYIYSKVSWKLKLLFWVVQKPILNLNKRDEKERTLFVVLFQEIGRLLHKYFPIFKEIVLAKTVKNVSNLWNKLFSLAKHNRPEKKRTITCEGKKRARSQFLFFAV